jgi:hypothetical protein
MAKHQLSGIYRREGEWTLIEIKLSETNQLFNSMDPSPFRERDLDPDAAAYIMAAVRELHDHSRVKLVVYFPGPHEEGLEGMIHQAIRNYFSYRERAARFGVRQKLRLGRSSLLVGLVFLAVCNVFRLLLPDEGVSTKTLSEGLLIVGWVAMWKPLEILLYEWWPLLTDARLDARIRELPVEVRVG